MQESEPNTKETCYLPRLIDPPSKLLFHTKSALQHMGKQSSVTTGAEITNEGCIMGAPCFVTTPV